MPSYQPFLIADFKTGLELDREPWLLPRDAFSSLTNAYIKYGKIKRRKGYTEFADIGLGTPTAITGITNHISTGGTNQLIVTDEKRTYKYSAGSLVDLDGADVWSGDENSLLRAVNYLGKLYMVNGNDPMRSYDGSTTAEVTVDITGDTNNDLDLAYHIFAHKERLVILHTSENGVRKPQRARWSSVSNPEDFTNDEYVDAPTAEWIVTAYFVGDDIVVHFEQSVWVLRYTGDSTLPFRWEKLNSTSGSTAFYSGVGFLDQGIALGKGGHIWTDSVHVQRIDQKIPDIVLTMNQDALGNSSSLFFEELSQVFTFYPTTNSTTKDNALILNFDEKTWAIYENMPFTTGGFFTAAQTQTWNTTTGTWLQQTEKWVASAIQAGYPIILVGGYDGKLYRLSDSSSDNGTAIEMAIESARWNPYASKGLKARLGWIDFLITPIAGETLTIELFTDFNSTAYKTEELPLDGNSGKEWVRIFSGEIGESHRLRISQTSINTPPEIHAIMPAFKPAGRI